MTRGDAEDVDPGRVASVRLGAARQVGWRKVVQEHEAAWSDRWRFSEIEVEGDAAAEQALRFAAYHLNSAANPADERVSIGARGLTGGTRSVQAHGRRSCGCRERHQGLVGAIGRVA